MRWSQRVAVFIKLDRRLIFVSRLVRKLFQRVEMMRDSQIRPRECFEVLLHLNDEFAVWHSIDFFFGDGDHFWIGSLSLDLGSGSGLHFGPDGPIGAPVGPGVRIVARGKDKDRVGTVSPMRKTPEPDGADLLVRRPMPGAKRLAIFKN